MPKETAVFDADDVIFDTMTALNEILLIRFGIAMKPEDQRIYGLDSNPKLKRITAEIKKIVYVDEFFAGLKPIVGAVEALQKIASQYRIIISTRRQSRFYSATKHGLERWEIPFADLFCGDEKYGVIRSVRPVLFVDDSLSEHFGVLPYRKKNPGFRQIINSRLWNDFYNDPRFIRAYDWLARADERRNIPQCINSENNG